MSKRIKIIMRPRIGFYQHAWRQRSEIPNRVGYKVLVLLNSGERASTEVVLRDGLHVLRDVPITEVAGWVPE